MDFETFKEEFSKAVKDHLEAADGKDYEVDIHKTEKMNESYDALTVKPEDSNIGVNINITQCFKEYSDGKDINEIAAKAADIAAKAIEGRPDFDIEALRDYDQMKNKLSMEVVSAERNAALLESVPHKGMEDMAIVYRFVLDSSEEGRSSILVTNKMLEGYGITADQLHKDAMEIAPEIRPAVIKGMSEVMAEMMGAEQAEMLGLVPTPDEPIFVATVPDKNQGASVIAYQDFMDQAAEKLGGDFYILPSSIHEILLVKDDGKFDKAALEQMVKEVNATQVAPEDKLTDNVYHYDSKDKIFELAGKYEDRIAGKEAEADVDIGSDEPDSGGRKSVIADLNEKKEQVADKPKKDDIKKTKEKGDEAL